jgi:hypothetical protein
MALLRKYWRHINLGCAVATFLFGFFLICWGPQATISRDRELQGRIERATEIESLRTECLDLNARMEFAGGASDSFSGVAVIFLFLVLTVSAFNVRVIRKIEILEKNSPSN